MAAGKDKAQKKPSVLRWRGVMGESGAPFRRITWGVLAITSASLAFTQMGFAGIGLPGEYVAYAITMLPIVALGALLFGTLAGTALGLFAGVALHVHAIFMPLDYYEAMYVTPLTSIVMLTVAGFILGILFALALRRNPSHVRRFVHIAVVCVVVSWLYSVGFIVNAVVSMAVDAASYASSLGETQITDQANFSIMQAVFNMGDTGIQAWFDALIMIILCCVGDHLARKAHEAEGHIGVRTIFGAWLAVVVFVVFMLMSVVSFVYITSELHQDAEEDIDSEVTYLCTQLEQAAGRAESLVDFLDGVHVDTNNLSDAAFDDLVAAVSYEGLLDGYTIEQDGLVVVGSLGYVYASDDERIQGEEPIENYFDDKVLAAIDASVATGNMQRITYDEEYTRQASLETLSSHLSKTHIAYLKAEEVESFTVIVVYNAEKVYAERSAIMVWTTISSLILLFVVFLLTFRLLERIVVRRIDDTNDVLARVTGGDLDARVHMYETRELNSLATGINDTVDALKGWISEAETRMDAELATAKAIQESALPRIFPPFPDIMAFDVYAIMHAAKEVGGDFYDFFLMGDDSAEGARGKLGFLVADVSGKGVPAALFMMNAKALIRGYLERGVELGEAVENANRQLCDGNEAGMFVTVWVGVLDYTTGHVDFVNAGHNPPLLWQEGAWRWMHEKSGLPLGLFEGLPYEVHGVDCQIGDQFLLYTDGVTEAMDMQGELYGEHRLEKIAADNFSLHPRPLIDVIRRDVAVHALGAEQSDDITMLALEVGVPPEVTATLIVPAEVGELPRVNEFIHTELNRRMCPHRAQNQLDIAVEELFVNVAHYAYPDATPDNPGMVRVGYTYSAEPPSVRIDIADDGVPYNPLAKPDAVTPDDIMDVPIGGLGILMAKRSVDEMTYERLDESNIVSILKKW